MSMCWVSNPREDAGRARVAAACAGLALLLACGPALAGRRDSLDTVSRVKVSERGIVVERANRSDTLLGGIDVKVGNVKIDVDDDDLEIDDQAALVRVFSDIEVPRGQHVLGDVVAVFGSVDVGGRVDGDVVSVMGGVTLRDSAVVEGEVVSVGGGLHQAPTAVVSGESVSLDFLPSLGVPGLPVMLGGIAACWAVSWLCGWLLAALFPDRLVRVAHVTSNRTAASLALGVLSVPGSILLSILLLMTIIGIPLALLLPFAYLGLAGAGQQAGTYLLGCKLLSRRVGQGGLMLPIAVGNALVGGFFVLGALLTTGPGARLLAIFFVLLGLLLVVVLSTLGTGAFLLSRLGTRPREVAWSRGASPSGAATPASPTVLPSS